MMQTILAGVSDTLEDESRVVQSGDTACHSPLAHIHFEP